MKKMLLVFFCALALLSGAVFAEDVKDATLQAENAAVLVANDAEKTVQEAEKAISEEVLAVEESSVTLAESVDAVENNAEALEADVNADSEGTGVLKQSTDVSETEYEICHHFITFNANPYAFQHITLHNKDSFNSKYGFGVNAGYRYSFGLFNAGLEVGYNNFNYEDYDRYHILSFTALGGISYYFTPKFFLDGDLGCGLDIRFMSDETRANFTTLARVNAGYWLTDLIAITGGADIKLSWQDHEVRDLDSTDFGVYVNIGTKISL